MSIFWFLYALIVSVSAPIVGKNQSMDHSESFLDRAVGCLVGLAVGDAVGTTVEFLPRGSYPKLTDMIGGGPFKLDAGQWTDDTSMALCLAESLIAHHDLNEHDLMSRFDRWVGEGYNSSTGSCFDIGQVTLRAISQFKRTGNPIAGPTKASDGGNGSVMRLAPVALSWWRDPQHAEVIARRQSATTHGSQECLDGCALLSRVLCSGISGSGVRSICTDDVSWSQSIRNIGLGSWRGKPEPEISSTGYVVHTLEAAFWAFEQSTCFEEAIITAVNLGHDSDTIGAVVGQIAGAVWGLSGIPAKWVERLYDTQRIQDLGRTLFDTGIQRLPLELS